MPVSRPGRLESQCALLLRHEAAVAVRGKFRLSSTLLLRAAAGIASCALTRPFAIQACPGVQQAEHWFTDAVFCIAKLSLE